MLHALDRQNLQIKGSAGASKANRLALVRLRRLLAPQVLQPERLGIARAQSQRTLYSLLVSGWLGWTRHA